MSSYSAKQNKDYLYGLKEQKRFAAFYEIEYNNGEKIISFGIDGEKNHTDNALTYNGIEYIYDFKGSKKIHSEGLTWIEVRSNIVDPITLKYVTSWFYAEMINSLVLELEDEYILYDIYKMREIVDKAREKMPKVYTTKKDELRIYQYYKRPDKKDITFQIPLKDIESCIIKKFPKTQTFYNLFIYKKPINI